MDDSLQISRYDATSNEIADAPHVPDGIITRHVGAYFGSYIKPANLKENRRDLRKAENRNDKERVVVAIRERNGRTVPRVFRSEGEEAVRFIRSRVAKGTRLHADEAVPWNRLHVVFEVNRINHSKHAYSLNGACTIWRSRFGATCYIIPGKTRSCSDLQFGCAGQVTEIFDTPRPIP